MAPKDFFFNVPLAEADPDVSRLSAVEAERQMRKLILIASESLCPAPVREALASEFVNLYAEGYPSTRMSIRERDRIRDHARGLAFFRRYGDRRYYKGTEYCDFIESLAEIRVAELFASDEVPASSIFANVQPLSGAAANNAVYDAFARPGDTILGLSLPHGGHLTHGSEFNRSGKTYRIVPYAADLRTGRLDYDLIMDLARRHRPRMIIVGFSAYPWSVSFSTFREIADASGAILFADIAHTAGLVVGGAYPNPVGYADVITFTTHKTMCGPRGAVILTTDPEHARAVDNAVFPGEQGGPHLHTIAAKAVAFKLASLPEFAELQEKVVENAGALARGFLDRSIPLAYGGTDTHLLLIDAKKVKTANGAPLHADIASRILDLAGITVNKNTIAGDERAAQPSGLRFGTTILTQRGYGTKDMDRLAEIVTDLLTASKPYEVQGQACRLGRAKIPADAFLECRRAVKDFDARGASMAVERIGRYPYFVAVPAAEGALSPPADRLEKAGAVMGDRCGRRSVLNFGDPEKETEAARKGSALIDNGDLGHFLVRGERAPSFLHAVLGADILTLGALVGVRTFLLDAGGKALDTVLVLRLPDGPFKEPRFLLRTSAETSKEAAEWLRALSDGYVEFGAGDLLAKVEGPVVIEDAPWTSFTLFGPESAAVAETFNGGRQAGEGGVALAVGAGGEEPLVFHPGDGLHEVLVPTLGAELAWIRLVEAGSKPAGAETRKALLEEKGYPGSEGVDRQDLSVLRSKMPPRAILKTKTFFVGMGESAGLPEGKVQPAYEYEPKDVPLRCTPLFEEHLKLTRKRNIIPFAGWKMPVVYTSITDEHEAVREGAGLFDVGHMGVFEVSGPNATRFLDLVTTNYVPKLAHGESMYAYLLDPDGKCIDDLMIYRVEPERFLVVVNAVNAEKDFAWLNAYNSGKFLLDRDRPGARIEAPAAIRDLKAPENGEDRRIDMALQGPRSIDTLLSLAQDVGTKKALRALARNTNTRATLSGIDLIVSRTGYTGEEWGYEMYVHPDKARALWILLLEAGRSFGVLPAGLGARDSLRTEAGLPLYGHELAGPFDIDPIEAGFELFVKWHKPFFVGRKPLLERMTGRKREIVRYRSRGKGARLAHTGDPVVNRNGKTIGRVTSAALAGADQIGMALVDKTAAVEGAVISIYCLPASGKAPAEGTKSALKPGDRVLLPLEGRIISRFPVSE